MNKTGVIFFLFIGMTVFVFMGVMYVTLGSTDRLFDIGNYEDMLDRSNIEAEAKILSIDDAMLFGGISLNERRYLEIKMEIDNNIDPPYIIAIDTTIPYGAVINKGDIIPVIVDKDNERAVVYDFEKGEVNKDDL